MKLDTRKPTEYFAPSIRARIQPISFDYLTGEHAAIKKQIFYRVETARLVRCTRLFVM